MAFVQVLTAEQAVWLAEIASADPPVAHTDDHKKKSEGVWGEARTRGFKSRQILLCVSQLGMVSLRSVRKNYLV